MLVIIILLFILIALPVLYLLSVPLALRIIHKYNGKYWVIREFKAGRYESSFHDKTVEQRELRWAWIWPIGIGFVLFYKIAGVKK